MGDLERANHKRWMMLFGLATDVDSHIGRSEIDRHSTGKIQRDAAIVCVFRFAEVRRAAWNHTTDELTQVGSIADAL